MDKNKTSEEMNLTITGIQIQEDREQGYCNKIIFMTEKGKVTFSPKNEVTKNRILPNGLLITQSIKELCRIDELPEIVMKINNHIKETGSCIVLCTITTWQTTDKDGKPVEYKFFSSMDTFNQIKILD